MSQREHRSSLRVQDNQEIKWTTKDGHSQGQGRIRNISSSGMCLETDYVPNPSDQWLLSFYPTTTSQNYIPSSGQLVWHRRRKTGSAKQFWGIRFGDATAEVSSKLGEKVQQGIKKENARRTFLNSLGVLVILASIALTGYVTWLGTEIYTSMQQSNHSLLINATQQSALTLSYAQRLEATELQLESTRNELAYVTKMYQDNQLTLQGVERELESTKAVLAQTQLMLSQATGRDLEEIQRMARQELSQVSNVLEASVVELQQDNAKLVDTIKTLQAKLDHFEGDIKNIEEGRALIRELKGKIKQVKVKIRGFQRAAEDLRLDALAQKDNIRLMLGNNGYLIRNGEPVNVDMEKYKAASLENLENNTKDVKVDVTIFE
jgi:cell division protein FtsB